MPNTTHSFLFSIIEKFKHVQLIEVNFRFAENYVTQLVDFKKSNSIKWIVQCPLKMFTKKHLPNTEVHSEFREILGNSTILAKNSILDVYLAFEYFQQCRCSF